MTEADFDSAIESILQNWEARFRVEDLWSQRVTGSIRLSCSGDNSSSYVILPGKPPKVVYKPEPELECDCTAVCSGTLLLEILRGQENPQALWHNQQITLTGEAGHLLFLVELIKDSSEQ